MALALIRTSVPARLPLAPAALHGHLPSVKPLLAPKLAAV